MPITLNRRTFILSIIPTCTACGLIPRTREQQPAVLGVIEYGQSNSEGQAVDRAALLRTDYPRQLRMPRTAANNIWLGMATTGGRSLELAPDAITGLAPLHGAMGSSSHGTTAGESMVLRLVDDGGRAADLPFSEVVLFNVAEGGQKIRNLGLNAAPKYHGFRNLQRATTAVHAALKREGKGYVVKVILTAQGESDAGEERLGVLQEQVRAEIESSVQTITGQRDPVWMLSVQPSSFQESSEGVRSILDEHVRTIEHGGAFFCLGPSYNFPFARDYLHHSSQGHDMRGELYAVAFQALLRQGRWDVLRATAARRMHSNRIAITLSEAAQVEHLTDLTAPDNLGIALSGGEIDTVDLAGDQLLITTRGAASAVTAVHIGLSGHRDRRGAASVPRTSIRSVASYGKYRNGTAIRKWLCHQSLPMEGHAG
ncbi:hypothetical protein [Massilia sp. LC238]|uniref:hypothetical protein n=1 Tax=Massilia sp. LC238 TaxID=1502852 RepID=UPI0004E2AB33|nr:hypothetical protein [Massilia sp. LC238]KFC76326.1 hypothetical protein FG94_00423 [Massilia sp. LC238]